MELSQRRKESAVPPGPPFAWWVARLSSERPLGDADERVDRCLEFIWTNLHRPLDVSAILRGSPASRRTMERSFRARLGRSIGEIVAHARFELALWLLAETELSLAEIAIRAGFSDSDWLGKTIKRRTGSTPTAIRRRLRGDVDQRD